MEIHVFFHVAYQRFAHGLDTRRGEFFPAVFLNRFAVHFQTVFAVGGVGNIGCAVQINQINVFHVFVVVLVHQKAVLVNRADFGVFPKIAALLIQVLLGFAGCQIKRQNARYRFVFHIFFAGVVQRGLHDAHQHAVARRGGQPFHAAVGAQMAEHGGQAAACGFHAARAHAFQLDAVAVKMHDVRAVFVRHPEGAVAHHRQPFAVDAGDVALQGLLVGIHHGFGGSAVTFWVGQAGEQFAVFIF